MRIGGLVSFRCKALLFCQRPLASVAKLALAAIATHPLRACRPFAVRSISYLPGQISDLKNRRPLFPRFYSPLPSPLSSRTRVFQDTMDEFLENLQDVHRISDSLGELCYQYYNRILILNKTAKMVPPENLRNSACMADLTRTALRIAAITESCMQGKAPLSKQIIQLSRLYTVAFLLAERTEIEILGYGESEMRLLRRAFNLSLVDTPIYSALHSAAVG